VPNRCGCTPTTCAAHNAHCGSINDGCGGTLPCGNCPGPQVCTSNACHPAPTTIAITSCKWNTYLAAGIVDCYGYGGYAWNYFQVGTVVYFDAVLRSGGNAVSGKNLYVRRRYNGGGWSNFDGPRSTSGSGAVEFVWNSPGLAEQSHWEPVQVKPGYELQVVFNGDADYAASTSGSYYLAGW